MSIWETHAEWWQERFTNGADDEYEQQMLPLVAERLVGSRRVLDIGTGEGQVARLLAGMGTTVVGVDRSSAMLELASASGGGPLYGQADITALPFADDSFDAVVNCLVLEHVEQLAPAVAEIARVLRPGGRYLLFLNHPAFQTPGSGWIDDHILAEQYWRSGPYLDEQTTLEEVDAGVTIPFAHRPLSTYVNLLAASGLVVVEMVEPRPSVVPEYPEASTIPRLLLVQAIRADLVREL